MAETPGQATKPGRKADKLTPKEITFLKGLAEGKTQTQAAMDAYNAKTEGTAASMAVETLKKPKIKLALQEAYEHAGLTPDAIAKAFKDGMSAYKTTAEKGVVYASKEPDHSVRVNAAGRAATLMLMAEKDEAVAPQLNAIQFNNFGPTSYIKKAEVNGQQGS